MQLKRCLSHLSMKFLVWSAFSCLTDPKQSHKILVIVKLGVISLFLSLLVHAPETFMTGNGVAGVWFGCCWCCRKAVESLRGLGVWDVLG